MEIVLVQDHETLGKAMDVLKVKDGYARNYLIPTGIAVQATEGNKKRVAESKRIADLGEEHKQKQARERAEKIEQIPCTIPVKVGEEDKLFGSVTAQEIAEFVTKERFDVEKRQVDLEEPIRQLGVYTVTIKLYRDVSARLKVWVVKEEQQ
jgi:large subunit ribosomal protein L9